MQSYASQHATVTLTLKVHCDIKLDDGCVPRFSRAGVEDNEVVETPRRVDHPGTLRQHKAGAAKPLLPSRGSSVAQGLPISMTNESSARMNSPL